MKCFIDKNLKIIEEDAIYGASIEEITDVVYENKDIAKNRLKTLLDNFSIMKNCKGKLKIYYAGEIFTKFRTKIDWELNFFTDEGEFSTIEDGGKTIAKLKNAILNNRINLDDFMKKNFPLAYDREERNCGYSGYDEIDWKDFFFCEERV